ncbi:DUF1963 domain-containing protein [Terribacillus goriensis]
MAGNPYFLKTDGYPLDGEGHPIKLLGQIKFVQLPKLKEFPESGLLLKFYFCA